MPIPRNSRVLITGHRGMVGSALMRRFEQEGFSDLLTATRDEMDLRDQAPVDRWFDQNQPEFIVHAAGTVGGIHANRSRPADFLYDNLMIHAHVMHAAHRLGVKKLLYLGSSCVYPRDCPQPIREEYLLSGPLEKTNEAYAIAKIAGLKACNAYRQQHGCNYISAMPTNLYGPNDNFDLQSSHVLPALMRKFHDCRRAAEEAGSEPGRVTVWGSGKPKREFLHVDDLADACLFLMDHYDGEETVNIGHGDDLAIAELVDLIRQAICPAAEVEYDASMPDGTPRKLLDVTKINNLGWKAQIPLSEGIASTYAWFLEHVEQATTGRSVRGLSAAT